jgi:hypothetical protein
MTATTVDSLLDGKLCYITAEQGSRLGFAGNSGLG